jgi:hypothetical protein
VVDAATRLAIPDVTVVLAELDLVLVTDAEGSFEVRDVPVGVYQLRLSAPGYRDATGNFAIMNHGSFVTALTPLGGAEAPARGRLIGVVTDVETQRPLEGVRVRVADVFLDGLTGEDGRFSFASVPPGRHAVDFSSLGYASRVDTIVVAAGSTSDARVAMALDPVEMEPISVVVERRDLGLEARGFYERRRLTTGEFIDREAIESQKPMVVTDLFSRINGAQLRMANPLDPLSRAIILTRSRGDLGGPCYPSVFVDGTRVHVGGDTPAMLNQIVNPDHVAGIEIYKGGASMPMEYGGPHAACGVIVIWTRR